MRKFYQTGRLPFLNHCVVLLLAILYLSISSCNLTRNGKDTQSVNDSTRIEWNILFKPNTNDIIRKIAINNIYDFVKDYYAKSKDSTKFYPEIFCSCDSLLYNISFSPIGGSGRSVVPPPPRKPLAGSGDFLNIQSISENTLINEKMGETLTDKDKVKAIVKEFPVNTSKILAIIDSGIDTTLFTHQINNLIWKDGSGNTLYNFLPSQPAYDLFDGTQSKHGSAVASIALKAMEGANSYSKLMILKALDNNNQGSVYSVSCALSYAIQKKANIINLSLGYFGTGDSILYHYLQLANTENPGVQIIAAAGNTPGSHIAGDICGGINSVNNLSNNTLFFPACFTQELKHLISVTQLEKPDLPCFYQNYSNKYISLGIINQNNCCAIPSGFLGSGFYEGSSFATPVASGLKMRTMLTERTTLASNIMWNKMVKKIPVNRVTFDGQYIEYPPPNFP